MSDERAFYFLEFVKMVLPLAPIGLVLVAMIFLRRKKPIPLTFWLQTTAAAWLMFAIANRFMLLWARGVFTPGKHDFEQLRWLFLISDITWNVETAIFIAFAILLLIYFRHEADAPYSSVQ